MPGKVGHPPGTVVQRKVIMLERRRKVAALYTAYLSQAEIAAELDISEQTVNADVKWIRAQIPKDVQEIVERDVATLDKLQKQAAIQFDATKDVAWHADQLGIMTRRARLLGLDKPTKQALTNKDGTGPAEIVVVGWGDTDASPTAQFTSGTDGGEEDAGEV